MSWPYNKADVIKTVNAIHPNGEIFECRVFNTDKDKNDTYTGYFDSVEPLCRALDNFTPGKDFYTFNIVLNDFDEAIADGRPFNRFGKSKGASDKDITLRRYLFIDCDAMRYDENGNEIHGVPSTDAEKALAKQKAQTIKAYLEKYGFAEPIFADSGNGYHLLYKINMPADDETKFFLKEHFFADLATVFADKTCEVDTSVFNAARVCKLYGTLAPKGAKNTEERPFRYSAPVSIPAEFKETSTDTVKALCGHLREDYPEKFKAAAEPARNEATHGMQARTFNGGDYDYNLITGNPDDALMCIPCPSDRLEWLKIGMAYKSAGGSYPVFDSWSSTGGNYNEPNNRKEWNKIKTNGKITEKTLYKIANDYGYFEKYLQPKATQTAKDTSKPNTDAPDIATVMKDAALKLIAKKRKSNGDSTCINISNVEMARLFAMCIKDHCRCVLDDNDRATKWYSYNGKNWESSDGVSTKKVREDAKIFALELCKAVFSYESDFKTKLMQTKGSISNEEQKKIKTLEATVLKLDSLNARKTLIEDASTVDGVSIKLNSFDSNPDLFNLQNGTFNLRTMELQPHNPADLLTKVTKGSYNADVFNPECAHRFSRWQEVLNGIFEGDEELIRFVHLVCGYMLTPTNYAEKLFFLFGPSTRNGKSTFIETISNALGSYSTPVEPTFFAAKNRNSIDESKPRPDIVNQRGSRLIVSPELQQGFILDTAFLKRFTGNSTITARPLFSNSYVSYVPTGKLFIDTNYLPDFSGNDTTLFQSNRVVIIPFDRHFEEDERDETLKDLLKTQDYADAVLTYCITGYGRIKAEGFEIPDRIKAIAAKKLNELDYIYNYFSAQLIRAPGYNLRNTEVFGDFVKFDSKHANMTVTQFNTELRKRGLLSKTGTVAGPDGKKRTEHNIVKGYRFRSDADEEENRQIEF